MKDKQTKECIRTWKGFDENWKCRDFQFKVGETFKHLGKVKACRSGFHACTLPIDVLKYYSPTTSVFAETLSSGEMSFEKTDSKVASEVIEIVKEVTISELINETVNIILNKTATNGEHSPSATSGYHSPSATSGAYSPSATSGEYSPSATSGTYSHSVTSGDHSPSATSGDHSPSATSGTYSHSATSGDHSPSATSGKYSIAAALGVDSKVKAAESGAIVLSEFKYINNELILVAVFSSLVGQNGIKPDTWYKLINGKPQEVGED